MAYIVVGLFAVFVVLSVLGVLLHIRVLMQAKADCRPLLKRALIRHNWEIAAAHIEPAGLADLERMRTLIDWMFKVGGVAFMLVAVMALFGWINVPK